MINRIPGTSLNPGYHPPTGFRFLVHIEDLKKVVTPDSWFQDVSGLTATVGTDSVREVGRLYSYHLPTEVTYANLVLKRGLFVDSSLTKWCRKAIEEFSFEPKNLTIQLISGERETLSAWQVEAAIPVGWSVSNFNAESSEVVIETITLKYHRFRFQSIIS